MHERPKDGDQERLPPENKSNQSLIFVFFIPIYIYLFSLKVNTRKPINYNTFDILFFGQKKLL